MPTASQLRFLQDEIFSLTLAATAQRSRLYRTGLSEAQRLPLHRSIRASLEALLPTYAKLVSDSVHIDNIDGLAKELSLRHQSIVTEQGMQFGHAQKALNLFLKYQWCLGQIDEPPHFPVDSVILKKIPGFTQVRWTRMTSGLQYRQIVDAARVEATREKLSLAQWELHHYNAQ